MDGIGFDPGDTVSEALLRFFQPGFSGLIGSPFMKQLIRAALFAAFAAFTLAPLTASASGDCVACCEGCYCPPCPPSPNLPPTPPSVVVGTLPLHNWDGTVTPIEISATQVPCGPGDGCWPVAQNLLGRTALRQAADFTGVSYEDAVTRCYWHPGFPPLLDCGWDQDYFVRPFAWLFDDLQRGRDLLMLQADGIAHWLGVSGRLDLCAGNHVACRWQPWEGPGCSAMYCSWGT